MASHINIADSIEKDGTVASNNYEALKQLIMPEKVFDDSVDDEFFSPEKVEEVDQPAQPDQVEDLIQPPLEPELEHKESSGVNPLDSQFDVNPTVNIA